MGAIEHLTVALPTETASRIRARVAAGDYRDESAVLEEALRALDTVDASIEAILPPLDEDNPEVQAWIKAEVTAALDEYDRDPTTGMSAEQLLAELAADRATLLKAG